MIHDLVLPPVFIQQTIQIMIFGEEDLSSVHESLHQYFQGKNETTDTDIVLNYSLGVMISLSAIISLVLNPLVCYLNYYQPASVARTLFMILNISDFLTNIYHPWICVKNFLKSDIGPPVRNAMLHEQVIM